MVLAFSPLLGDNFQHWRSPSARAGTETLGHRLRLIKRKTGRMGDAAGAFPAVRVSRRMYLKKSSGRRKLCRLRQYACRKRGGPFGFGPKTWEAQDMTNLAEAEGKFGRVVRDAGGAIFGIERGPSIGSRYAEKLQIGTPDGFVKIAILLNQPNIDAVLREQTAVLVRHAGELRTAAHPALAGSSIQVAPAGRR
jgi:hypothetical protein